MGSVIDIECFYVYVDYELCIMKYKDVFVWKVDFEKFISFNFKYRVFNDVLFIIVILRGDCEYWGVGDFVGFFDLVNFFLLYRVVIRDVEKVGFFDEEFVWIQVVKKYIGGEEDELS